MAPLREQHPADGPHATPEPRGEFLETNGLGGYCCSAISGVRTSPSHGLVVVAKDPPGQRYVLLSGFRTRVITGRQVLSLGCPLPEGSSSGTETPGRLLRFGMRPWPVWRYDLGGGKELEFECLARHGSHQFVFSWQLTVSDEPVTLKICPLLSGRPVASPRKADFRLDLRPRLPSARQFLWTLRAGAPPLMLVTDGSFHSQPEWITGFSYADQSVEDLASPGEFEWHLQPRERAHLVASADDTVLEDPHTVDFVAQLAEKIRKAERTRRRLFRSEIDRAADQYVAAGRSGSTVLSGYPGGEETGSEALICVRGIALSPGRLNVASEILATWRGRLTAGLLPNVISEQTRKPAYHSPAPALWYVIAAYEYIRASYRHGRIITPEERTALLSSIREILDNFSMRRQPRMFMDDDALLTELLPGKNGEPDILRKRAHIQALWIAALRIGNRLQSAWPAIYATARSEFQHTFWSHRRGYLYPAITVSARGPLERLETLDANQILAVGGLPIVCVSEDKASLIVEALEQHFQWGGGLQNTKHIPWQFGPFTEAWFRVHHRNPEVRDLVLRKFIAPWENRLRSGVRATGTEPSREEHGSSPCFAAAETTELLRILHLPELLTNPDPFDDHLGEPLFYD